MSEPVGKAHCSPFYIGMKLFRSIIGISQVSVVDNVDKCVDNVDKIALWGFFELRKKNFHVKG